MLKLVVRKSRTSPGKLSVRLEGNEYGSIRDAITELFQEGTILIVRPYTEANSIKVK